MNYFYEKFLNYIHILNEIIKYKELLKFYKNFKKKF